MRRRIGQGIGAVLVAVGALGLALLAYVGAEAGRLRTAAMDASSLREAQVRFWSISYAVGSFERLASAFFENAEFGAAGRALEEGESLRRAIDDSLLGPEAPVLLRSNAFLQDAKLEITNVMSGIRAASGQVAGARADGLVSRLLATRSAEYLPAIESLHLDVLAEERRLEVEARAAAIESDRLAASLLQTTILAGACFVLVIVALWHSSVRRLVRPLEDLRAEADRVRETGQPFRLEPAGPLEVVHITEAVSALSEQLTSRLLELDHVNRRLDREHKNLLRTHRDLGVMAGANKDQLTTFERMTDQFTSLHETSELSQACVQGVCELLGARGASARLLVGDVGEPAHTHLTHDGLQGLQEQARLRDRLIAGTELEPSVPKATGGAGSTMLEVDVLSSNGQLLARMRAAEPVDLESGREREFQPSDVDALRAVAALFGAHLERATLTESLIARMLRMVQLRDPDETHEHAQRVGEISVRILDRWNARHRVATGSHEWDSAAPIDRQSLRHAAQLHDVGKVGVPDRILTKSGPLSADERLLMHGHTSAGAQFFRSGVTPFDALAEAVAHHHHQRWDGTGYPAIPRDDGTIRPLRREEIPFGARIVAIADVLDALISARVYKDAWPLDEAIAEIKSKSGAHFEPALVDCLEEAVEDPRFRACLATR